MHWLVSSILADVPYGNYISVWKTAVLLVFVLIWARLLTWVDKDAIAAHLPRLELNAGFLCGLVVAFFAFLFVPNFFAALGVFVLVMLVEGTIYLAMRHKRVGLKDLNRQFKTWLASFSSKKEVKAEAGQVLLMDRKGVAMAPPVSEAPERPAYTAVQELLTDPLRRNAERIEMRPGEGAATVRYSVDGVSVDGRSIARDDAAAGVTILKQLAGLDVRDKRKPQTGSIRTTLDGVKRELVITTAGSTAGENITIEVEPKKRHELRSNELGLTESQFETVEGVIGEGEGIVLLVAPKGHGLTSMLYAILRRHDAFLSHIQTIERDASTDLEGINQNKLAPGAAPGEEAKLVSWMCSQEPDVVMVDKVEDPQSAAQLIKFAGGGRRVYIGMRGGSTFEALQAWRNLVGDDKLAMKSLRMVVAGRLLRKLCTACKVDYTPDPETLRKLGMAPEKVGRLFTARTQPLRDQKGNVLVCEFCLDLRFRGRTGIFEIFLIDDEVREVVKAGGSVNQLKMQFKKQRQRYLQEQALGKAVAGDTSLQEVARVLRASDAAAKKSG